MKNETQNYGKELGIGIKESLKGLNTVASPRKRKTCIILSFIPIIGIVLGMIGGVTGNDTIIGLVAICCFLSGACNFYIGKFKKGVIYSLTMGFFVMGALIDLFKLTVTRTLRDANGFPIIY